jgi:DNA-binding HxlR family transcriptional regulator
MKKRVVSGRRSGCPLNATLEVLGDRWSLLIVRDLMFKGRTTYKDFLAGGERIATNVLADRLRRLAAEGVIEKGRDAADARRLVYRLTVKGLALAPVLVELIVWGARHYQTAAPPATIRAMTEHRERFLADIRSQAGAA